MLKNFVYILPLFLIISCSKQKPEIRVGFSHADLSRDWGTLMYQEIANELSLYYDYNVKLIVRDAQANSQKQIRDIIELSKNGIDVLIIFPNDSITAMPVVEKLFDKKIPVVIVDRKLNTEKYNVFISNDNVKIGIEAGNYALNVLKFKGKVLEILGIKGSSTSSDRSKGFSEAIQKSPGITIGSRIYGEWFEPLTALKTDSVLKSGFIPDLIFAHSDVMAQVAHNICQRNHIKPIIIGVDGLPNKNAGLDLVLNKQIDATFYNYPGGDIAAQYAMSLVLKKKAEKNIQITLKTFPININNAESIKVGYEMQLKQFNKIRKQQLQIGKMFVTIKSQTLLIYFSSVVIILLFLILFVITYFLKQKQNFILLIKSQKEKIEQQIEEEKSLSDQLLVTNNLLQSQREEILQKNKYLEKYQNHLEQLVHDRTTDMEVALEKAQESDRLKTSFLSNLSHEIRTPLNSIMGFADLLASSNSSNLEKESFRSILIQNCNQFLNSINQIVEIAKFSTEHVEFKNSVISVNQLFNELNREIANYISQVFGDNNSKVEFNIIPATDIKIATDVFRIKQVLTYLIDNALKFTNTGNIYIGVEVVNKNYARFYVKDTGIGIKEQNQEIIFGKFRKVEDEGNVLFRGTGLGLAISKQIVELLGGSISVESELGKGSVFSFIIPGIIE